VIARLIASGFGAGFAPVAPGTVGALAAAIAGGGLMRLSPWALPVGVVIATAAGLWSIAASGARDDPGWVVVDEVAGQWVAMLGLSHLSLAGLAASFVLFRALDIGKPGPVGWADRRGGAFWVMADDLIAGAIAALALGAWRWWFGDGII
jgi:phosphatidylglycerophosphatase A